MGGNRALAGLLISISRVNEDLRLKFRRGVAADRLLIMYQINRKGWRSSRPGTIIAMLSNTTEANQAGISSGARKLLTVERSSITNGSSRL